MNIAELEKAVKTWAKSIPGARVETYRVGRGNANDGISWVKLYIGYKLIAKFLANEYSGDGIGGMGMRWSEMKKIASERLEAFHKLETKQWKK